MALTIRASSNWPTIARQVEAIGRQAQYAAAVALTRTAGDIRTDMRAEMARVFDRPTPYTLGSLFVRSATRTRLEAEVWIKDNTFGKGTPADRYLLPQIAGGERSLKSFEKALAAAGYLPAGYRTVPGAGAKIDQYGNMRASQIVQIMSQLRLQIRSGYSSNRSNSRASRRTVARQGVTYFVLSQRRGSLKPGVYARRTRDRSIVPVLVFVSRAQYKPRLPFFEVAERTAARRFPPHFDAELSKALATAIPTQQGSLL